MEKKRFTIEIAGADDGLYPGMEIQADSCYEAVIKAAIFFTREMDAVYFRDNVEETIMKFDGEEIDDLLFEQDKGNFATERANLFFEYMGVKSYNPKTDSKYAQIKVEDKDGKLLRDLELSYKENYREYAVCSQELKKLSNAMEREMQNVIKEGGSDRCDVSAIGGRFQSEACKMSFIKKMCQECSHAMWNIMNNHLEK
jgi:hypothetical protein